MISMKGAILASEIRAELADVIKNSDIAPKLVVVLVGNDPASEKYVAMKEKASKEIAIDFELVRFSQTTPDKEIREKIFELDNDDSVSGIIVQLPLPTGHDTEYIIESIVPGKDVDGLTAESIGRLIKGLEGFVPATALGIMALLHHHRVEIGGRHAVVVGASNLVGKPTALLLLKEGATTTICHIKTPDLSVHTRTADIVVSAVGKPGLITKDMLKEGAAIVDVGITMVDGRAVGDVAPDVAEVAAALSPSVGGVGPLTVAMLLSNVVKAAERQKNG